MSKRIDIETRINLKKSKDFKEIAHKSVAGMSEDEAIERNVLGSFGDNGEGEEEEDTDVQ